MAKRIWREDELEDFYNEMKFRDICIHGVLTSGYFNPIHAGHIRLIRSAKKFGSSILVVAVNGDLAAIRKHGYSFIPIEQRLEIISEIRGVDCVIETNDDTMLSVLYNLRPRVFAKGGDVTEETFNVAEKTVCDDLGIDVQFGVGGGKQESSSNLLRNYVRHFYTEC